jgi:hypothetical protein
MEVDFTKRPIGFKFKSKVHGFKGKIIKNPLTMTGHLFVGSQYSA